MIFLAAIIGLLIFIYFNRYVQQRRSDKRDALMERKEQFLQQLRDMKNKDHED